MGRFPKYAVKRENVLKSSGIMPIGAFFKDGQIFPGFDCVQEWTGTVVPNISAMCWSKVGNGILAGTSDGGTYRGQSGAALTRIYADGGNSPFVFHTYSGSERAVLVSGRVFTTISGNDTLHADFPLNLTKAIIRRGRLFGIDAEMPYTLRWSDTGGFLHWEKHYPGAGSLILEPDGGQITDLFDFEDGLIVFREHSIMRFSVYGDPENFRELDTLQVPDIFRKTAAIAGDSILFFCNGGLMRYRSGKVSRVEGLISDDMTEAISCHVCDGRYYFISGISKSLGVSVVYIYDFILDCYEVLEVTADFISQDSQSVLAYNPHGVFRIMLKTNRTEYRVVTAEYDFGTDRRKLATVLEVDCDEDVKVIIDDGIYRTTYRNNNGRKRINLRGNKFKLTFSGTKGAVRSAYLTAEVVE